MIQYIYKRKMIKTNEKVVNLSEKWNQYKRESGGN